MRIDVALGKSSSDELRRSGGRGRRRPGLGRRVLTGLDNGDTVVGGTDGFVYVLAAAWTR